MEEIAYSKGWGKGRALAHSGACHSPSVSTCSPPWEFSEPWTLSCWVCLEASLYRHDGLNYWPLVTDSTCGPSFSQDGRGRRGRAESSNPSITGLVPWQPAATLRCFPKSHLLNITKDTFLALNTLGNSKGNSAKNGAGDQVCMCGKLNSSPALTWWTDFGKLFHLPWILFFFFSQVKKIFALCKASAEKKRASWAVRPGKGNLLEGNESVTGF